jgi:hypothetical protein
MQITSAMKMVSAAKQESTRCNYNAHAEKKRQNITKSSATLEGDAQAVSYNKRNFSCFHYFNNRFMWCFNKCNNQKVGLDICGVDIFFW